MRRAIHDRHCVGRTGKVRPIAIANGICLGLLAATLTWQPALAAAVAAPPLGANPSLSARQELAGMGNSGADKRRSHPLRRADFAAESASGDARELADWIVDAGDSQGMPFAIIDKKDAKVFVFAADGRLRGAAAALLGMAIGDDAVPGIGNRPLSSIRPEERTTPAGRFVAALDRNLRGKEILWVDYDGAVSMHPVVSAKPEERRLQRLATPTPLDNRISYGCINVPPQFFDSVVRPAFSGTNGIVYILPETRSARIAFGSYAVGKPNELETASQERPTAR